MLKLVLQQGIAIWD